MELSDYIPDYPDVSAETFYNDIYRKKEFYELRSKYYSTGAVLALALY
jgi:hypothetical protein